MAEFNVRDIVGDRLLCGSFGQDLVSWHIEELRLRIDKTADQPGAGNPIDFGPFTRNPLHGIAPFSPRLAVFFSPRKLLLLLPPLAGVGSTPMDKITRFM